MEVARQPARRGRRAGNPETRAQIVRAALDLFLKQGFASTSMRAVARAADCDAALVHHYFSSKEQLFFEALEIWADVDQAIAFIDQQGRRGLGRRAFAVLTEIYETYGDQLLAQLAKNPELRALFAKVIGRRIDLLAARLTTNRTAQRRLAAQAEAIIAGYVTTRYLLQTDHATALGRDEAIEYYGELLQHAIDRTEGAKPK